MANTERTPHGASALPRLFAPGTWIALATVV
jgi:hypothetical protein